MSAPTTSGKHVVLLWGLVLALGLTISLVPALRDGVGALVSWLERSGPAGWAGFVVVYALATVMFVPRSLLNALGGWAFGALGAGGLAFLGSMIAAATGYALASRWSSRAGSTARAERAAAAIMANDTVRLTVLYRLSMVFPFALLNVTMGAYRAPRGRFLLGTALGIPPATFLQTWVGSLTRDVSELVSGGGQHSSTLVMLAGGLVVAAATSVWVARRAAEELRRMSAA